MTSPVRSQSLVYKTGTAAHGLPVFPVREKKDVLGIRGTRWYPGIPFARITSPSG
nr:hypothetical protein [uncultured Methanoregula sp.]